MALTEPQLDLHAFFNSGPNRSTNALGKIDDGLVQWAKLLTRQSSSKDRIAQLFKIAKSCQDWLDNDWERARYHGENKPAVEALLETAWRRVEWEHYTHAKRGGASANLKSLAGHHQFEADVMHKTEYKNEHVGINSVEDILNGFSADRTANTALDATTKSGVKKFLTDNAIPSRVGKMSAQQYQQVERFIVQSGIDSQFRQEYYSVDERISRMLVPDKQRNVWYYKPGEPFDTAACGFTQAQALYVVDKYGNWFVDEGKPGVVNHSSLCRGQPILCGGMLEARQGRLTSIINNSGHYCPDRFQFAAALKTVEKLFNNWETIEVTVTRGKGDDVTFGGSTLAGRVSPVKFIRNPDHAGNGGKSFAAW